jgi:hypothetical protein
MNWVGIKWALALTIDYLEWPEVPANDGYSEYTIDPGVDHAVTELHDLGFDIIYSLAFWVRRSNRRSATPDSRKRKRYSATSTMFSGWSTTSRTAFKPTR